MPWDSKKDTDFLDKLGLKKNNFYIFLFYFLLNSFYKKSIPTCPFHCGCNVWPTFNLSKTCPKPVQNYRNTRKWFKSLTHVRKLMFCGHIEMSTPNIWIKQLAKTANHLYANSGGQGGRKTRRPWSKPPLR